MCTGTVFFGTWSSLEMSADHRYKEQEVGGKIKCVDSEFGGNVTIPDGKKECYCRHKNPRFLDE